MKKTLFFLAVSLCFISCQNKGIKVENTTTITLDSLNGVYIPKDLDDCFVQLDKMLNDTIKTEIKSGSEDDMNRYHMGLGMYLRNSWGLWKGSRLANYFHEKGAGHPDDISGIVLTSYYRYLNGEDIKLEKQIELMRAFYPPTKDMYPIEVKSFSISGSTGEGFNDEGFPVMTFYGKDTITNIYWEYHTIDGWEKMTEEEYASKFGAKFIAPEIMESEE